MSALWTSTQVCDDVGVTYRQLDSWERRGIVTASVPAAGHGTRRMWTRGDVERVRHVAEVARRRRVPLAELV